MQTIIERFRLANALRTAATGPTISTETRDMLQRAAQVMEDVKFHHPPADTPHPGWEGRPASSF